VPINISQLANGIRRKGTEYARIAEALDEIEDRFKQLSDRLAAVSTGNSGSASEPRIVVDFTVIAGGTPLIAPSLTAAPDKLLVVILQQDATGGRQWTWDAAFENPPDPALLDMRANQYLMAPFAGRNDSRWWPAGTPMIWPA
jgi:hypothetical protein